MLKKVGDVGDMLSLEYTQKKAKNRSYLLKVLQNVIYLARQGLPLRGNWVAAEGGGGCEEDSNFYQLMQLRAIDDPLMTDVMKRKKHKYTDHHIQNELLQLTAFHHLRKIADNIRSSGYFALEVDEVTDSSNKEQVIICLRWIDSELQPHEEFKGLHCVEDITTSSSWHITYEPWFIRCTPGICHPQSRSSNFL